jgi:hypothetical protein
MQIDCDSVKRCTLFAKRIMSAKQFSTTLFQDYCCSTQILERLLSKKSVISNQPSKTSPQNPATQTNTLRYNARLIADC